MKNDQMEVLSGDLKLRQLKEAYIPSVILIFERIDTIEMGAKIPWPSSK